MNRLKVLKIEVIAYSILQLGCCGIAIFKSMYHFNTTAEFALILALIFGVLQRVVRLEIKYYE